MTTNTAGSVAREAAAQQIHYLRKTIDINTPGISTGVKMPARLPAGAEVLFTIVKIKTAFDAVTTNVLTVGQNSTTFDDFVNAGDTDETTVQSNMVLRGGDVNITADTDVFIKYTQTGTAAQNGKATVIVAYVPNNDE